MCKYTLSISRLIQDANGKHLAGNPMSEAKLKPEKNIRYYPKNTPIDRELDWRD